MIAKKKMCNEMLDNIARHSLTERERLREKI